MLNTLGKRILTAGVLAPLFILAIFKLSNEYFSILLLAIVALSAWEFSRLIQFQSIASRTLYTVAIVGFSLLANNPIHNLQTLLVVTALWWGLNLYWILRYPQHSNIWFDSPIIRSMSGVLLLVPMWVALVHIHNKGVEYFLLLMLLIWAADSGAYFVGRAFGKRKLAPNVSPGKTIEGVIGGVIASSIVMLLFLQISLTETTNYLGYLLLAITVAGVSVLGDLFESLYKRESGFKDSGHILPGHGGVLDRIDSLTAAAPFFLLGLHLL